MNIPKIFSKSKNFLRETDCRILLNALEFIKKTSMKVTKSKKKIEIYRTIINYNIIIP